MRSDCWRHQAREDNSWSILSADRSVQRSQIQTRLVCLLSITSPTTTLVFGKSNYHCSEHRRNGNRHENGCDPTKKAQSHADGKTPHHLWARCH